MGEIVRFRATTKVHPTLSLILALIAIEANFFTNFEIQTPTAGTTPSRTNHPLFAPGQLSTGGKPLLSSKRTRSSEMLPTTTLPSFKVF